MPRKWIPPTPNCERFQKCAYFRGSGRKCKRKTLMKMCPYEKQLKALNEHF